MNELLRALGEGGIYSTAELARGLGISQGMVAAMAEELARHGYLAALAGGCSTGCKGCSAATTCLSADEDGPGHPFFVLTEKGRHAARRIGR